MIIKLKAPRTANGYPVQMKIDTEKRVFSVGICQFLGGYEMARKSDLQELRKELLANGYIEE